MTISFSSWHPLAEAEVASLPDSPGVFEVATLVRTVLLIGAAPESLVTTLTRQLDTPGTVRAQAGRLYFRCYATEESERLQGELLQEYRTLHGGELPPAQTTPPPPQPRPIRHLKAVV